MTKMLLKQANPEHADSALRTPDPPAMHLDPSHQDGPVEANTNDILDDVFGDEHDVSPDPHSHHIHDDTQEQHHHPSDIHRLQQEHTTAGYRDGITVAKAASIQSGFDEGFGLGATIGLKVGRLLGLLEGIAAATTTITTSSTVASEGGRRKEEETANSDSQLPLSLLADARAELGVKSIFSETFWNADGTWKYVVGGKPAIATGINEDDNPDAGGESAILFAHVAEAHPLVKRWTVIVEGEMRRWGLRESLPLLERRDDHDNDDEKSRGRGRIEPPIVTRAKATGQSQGEAKAPNDALSW